ncbi:site-specific integrase [Flavobacterium humi]|uniref:Tyr recombinase domain-containing protein n=1 Tax=Flavobacterium humi TaxID=2562683 RepID=A0A4Z0L4P4_9FLAO|nr:hypothetical protein [Flavobacterium humi]TGD57328.1 hypothetical protein E4635_11960 [Flavobacterium humi]
MKKPVINYVLESKAKNPNERTKPELIIAMVHAGFITQIDNQIKHERFKVSLETTIKPKNFGLIKDNFRFNEDVFANFSRQNKGVKTAMQIFETKVDELYSNYLINDIQPTAKQFKTDLLIQLGRKQREQKKTFTILAYLNDKISLFESLKGSGRKDEIDENSIKVYRTLKVYLERYELVKQIQLTFENFDESTYWEFWNIQDEILRGKISIPKKVGERKIAVQENGFLMSSINKYQKTLMRLLRLAIVDGINVNLNVNNTNLIVTKSPASKDIYVSESDLVKIWNYEPTTTEMLLAKDYLMLASLTGMRYESMEVANLEQIETYKDGSYNFSYIHSKQNKTETECYIPLFNPVMEILKRYGNKFPVLPANQIVNENIKMLFGLAGINAMQTITNVTYKSGVIIESKPANEVISTHDCRKSFITNLFLAGGAENIVMGVTHPDKKPMHAMAGVYNKSTLLDKAKQFYDEVNRVQREKQSELYKF